LIRRTGRGHLKLKDRWWRVAARDVRHRAGVLPHAVGDLRAAVPLIRFLNEPIAAMGSTAAASAGRRRVEPGVCLWALTGRPPWTSAAPTTPGAADRLVAALEAGVAPAAHAPIDRPAWQRIALEQRPAGRAMIFGVVWRPVNTHRRRGTRRRTMSFLLQTFTPAAREIEAVVAAAVQEIAAH
jgi:hypothetical protein